MLISLYLKKRFFYVGIALVILFALGFVWPFFLWLAQFVSLIFLITTLLEIFLLFRIRKGVSANRLCADRFSNGDENAVQLVINNHYRLRINLEIIDEIPFQFQRRDVLFKTSVEARKTVQVNYTLRPTERGEYSFGALNIFVLSPIGFAARRYSEAQNQEIEVYPSYLDLHKYELLAISNKLVDVGIKRIRKLAQNSEFEQIKDYVKGDDFRTINWKATARRGHLMVNMYQDERSQPVYSVIDKGRVMKMPFHGLSLLDYAINASLVISNVAVKKYDKAGLITFEKGIDTYLPASKRQIQMRLFQQALYKQNTNYLESDFSELFAFVKRRLNNRSLLILYTNFESKYAAERQLPYLRKLAHHHLLVVVFFENSELNELIDAKVYNKQEIYDKVIAEKFAMEKKEIVKMLQNYGIHSVLTEPEHLNINVINKYLELKSRNLI